MNLDNLTAIHPDVPTRKPPLHWNIERGYMHNCARIDGVISHYNSIAASPIDEAAVLVPDAGMRQEFHRLLLACGWEHFNSAEDLVFTNPFSTRYFVEYQFYRHPDYLWRLELMMMGRGRSDDRQGVSPLHAGLYLEGAPELKNGDGHLFPIPHLSYKVAGRGAFAKEQDRLRQWGSHAQTCQSTYGVFSYWIPTSAERQVYLKPRANLRDEGEASVKPAV